MFSFIDYIILHCLFSAICFACMFAVYHHGPKSFSERAKSSEFNSDISVFIMSFFIPFLTLPILILHFREEIIDTLQGKTWEDRNK